MRVLFDLNVVLDLLLDRHPWVDDVRPLAARVLSGEVEGYVAAISVPTMFYIARRTVGDVRALHAVDLCLRTFEIASVGKTTLVRAVGMSGRDYEDNVQVTAAVECRIDVIVTRDADFADRTLPVMLPAELGARLSAATP